MNDRHDAISGCSPVARSRCSVRILGAILLLALGAIPWFVPPALADPEVSDFSAEHGWASDDRWSHEFAVPEPDDAVLAVESYDGDLIIGGPFRQIGTAEAPGLARWDGRGWHSIRSSPGDPVTALLVEGPVLMLANHAESAGTFATVSRWNGHSWSTVGDEAIHGVIVRLLRWNGDLVAAGALGFPDGGTYALARLEHGKWRPLGPAANLGSVEVRDAAVFLDQVFVAGKFQTSAGSPSSGVLRLARNGASFDTLANASGTIATRANALALQSGALVVAGSFKIPAPHVLMAWTGSEWRALDDGPFGSVTALRSTSAGILVGGQDGPGQAGVTLVGRLGPEGWTMMSGPKGTLIRALAMWRGEVVAGGDPQALVLEPGTDSGFRRLALFDGQDWHAAVQRGADAAGLDGGYVGALLKDDRDLVATGTFYQTWVGDFWLPTYHNIVRLVNHHWQAMGHLLGTGLALASYRGELYAGGDFTLPSGDHAGLMRFDGVEWQPVAGSTEAHALAILNDRLIAAGRFSAQVPGIAQFDGTTWSAIGPGIWPPDSTSRTNALLSYHGSLYVAGCYTGIPGIDPGSIARWDGVQWTDLRAEGCDVTALAGYGEGIAAGGSAGVAIWDGRQWNAPLGVAGNVAALASDGSVLFIGRHRSGLSDSSEILTAWDGRRLHSLGSGIEKFDTTPRSAAVTSLVASDDILWVGGSFRRAGDVAAWNVAAWTGLKGRLLREAQPFVEIAATPNPSRRGQVLEFALPPMAEAQLGIYDLTGRRLRAISVHAAPSGAHVTWDGRDSEGRETPEGIYFVNLRSLSGSIATRRIIRLP